MSEIASLLQLEFIKESWCSQWLFHGNQLFNAIGPPRLQPVNVFSWPNKGWQHLSTLLWLWLWLCSMLPMLMTVEVCWCGLHEWFPMSHRDGLWGNILRTGVVIRLDSWKQFTFAQAFASVSVDTLCRCFWFQEPQFLRSSSVSMHCYARSATHDTWSGLIHFSPICLFVRWL